MQANESAGVERVRVSDVAKVTADGDGRIVLEVKNGGTGVRIPPGCVDMAALGMILNEMASSVRAAERAAARVAAIAVVCMVWVLCVGVV